ncbi:MAG TPA: TetR/AcrR family transcriptional regulator [Ktedonobacterales bacterium]|nr:TetR/AcrR family transcriptional regulator [Ktedonobacterales bacterium]
MPRNEETNQRMRESQRAKILEAALQVFARKGVAATMADVAAAAGVSQGLAYRYFANKEAIYHALIEQTVQLGNASTPYIEEMPGTPGERLNFLLSRVMESRRQNTIIFQLFYHVLSDETTPDTLRELVSKRGLAMNTMLRQLIVEGQTTGEVAEGDPDQLVTAFMAYLDGITRIAVYNPEQFKKHFPDNEIILRIFKPSSNRPQKDNRSGDEPEEGNDT